MQKIGIFGGSFNPVHNGHLNLARGFYERLGLDRVILIPVHLPPHKDCEDIIDGSLRLEMCRLACQDKPWLEVSDIELKRGGKSYTARTLEQLTGLYPGASFYLLMGADMFLTIEQWNRFETIIRLCSVCCTMREHGDNEDLHACARRLGERYHAKCFIENIPVLELSSTQVRDKIARGESVKGLVPDGVLDYIRQKGLYKNSGR